MNFKEYKEFYRDKGYLPCTITWNRLPEYVTGLIESESYVGDVALAGTDLIFTGIGDAFSGTIDLSALGGGGSQDLASVLTEGNKALNSIILGDANDVSPFTTGITIGISGGNGISNPYDQSIVMGDDIRNGTTNAFNGGNIITGYRWNFGQGLTLRNNVYGLIASMWDSTVGTTNGGIGAGDPVVYASIGVGHKLDLYGGKFSAVFGQKHSNGASSNLVAGLNSIDLTQTIGTPLNNPSNYNPRMVIGNGTYNEGNDLGTSSNAFVVMSDGVVSAPSLAIASIDNPTIPVNASANFGNRVLITKEYFDANAGGSLPEGFTASSTGFNLQNVVGLPGNNVRLEVGGTGTPGDVVAFGDIDDNDSGFYASLNQSAGTFSLLGSSDGSVSGLVFGRGSGTRLNSISSTASRLLQLPDATGTLITTVNGLAPDNFGNVVVASGGGALEVLDEGNGDGIVVAGRIAANYGDVGLNAVDLSNNSAASTTHGATGNWSFVAGQNVTADGFGAVALGRLNVSSGIATFAAGQGNTVTGNTGFAIGSNNTASGVRAICLGAGNQSLGQNSMGIGSSNVTSFSDSFGIGFTNTASANGAGALGYNNFARSFGEISVGLYGTDYVASSPNTHQLGDRIFNVGIGTNVPTRADGFTILKNGNTAIGINNFEANDTGEKLQVSGKVKASELNLTGLPVHADEAAAVVAGLVTGDVYMTATGELRIKL